MDLKTIIDLIRSGQIISPGDLAEYRLRLAAEYGYHSEQLSQILKAKPQDWLEIRQRSNIKSDKIADRLWEMTEMGQQEMSLKMTLKTIEKVSSAISTQLKMYETEARLQQ
ncbi:MAG: hypothetical protein GY861_18190 [bacterium]|nr:hypothetical protein [bacterium]